MLQCSMQRDAGLSCPGRVDAAIGLSRLVFCNNVSAMELIH